MVNNSKEAYAQLTRQDKYLRAVKEMLAGDTKPTCKAVRYAHKLGRQIRPDGCKFRLIYNPKTKMVEEFARNGLRVYNTTPGDATLRCWIRFPKDAPVSGTISGYITDSMREYRDAVVEDPELLSTMFDDWPDNDFSDSLTEEVLPEVFRAGMKCYITTQSETALYVDENTFETIRKELEDRIEEDDEGDIFCAANIELRLKAKRQLDAQGARSATKYPADNTWPIPLKLYIFKDADRVSREPINLPFVALGVDFMKRANIRLSRFREIEGNVNEKEGGGSDDDGGGGGGGSYGGRGGSYGGGGSDDGGGGSYRGGGRSSRGRSPSVIVPDSEPDVRVRDSEPDVLVPDSDGGDYDSDGSRTLTARSASREVRKLTKLQRRMMRRQREKAARWIKNRSIRKAKKDRARRAGRGVPAERLEPENELDRDRSRARAERARAKK
jgi:hypothetical protein